VRYLQGGNRRPAQTGRLPSCATHSGKVETSGTTERRQSDTLPSPEKTKRKRALTPSNVGQPSGVTGSTKKRPYFKQKKWAVEPKKKKKAYRPLGTPRKRSVLPGLWGSPATRTSAGYYVTSLSSLKIRERGRGRV